MLRIANADRNLGARLWGLTTTHAAEKFSLHSCRSSSVNFFYFSQRSLAGILRDFFRHIKQRLKRCFRGLPSGGASFKVENAHFAARKKGRENRKNEVKLRPPSVPIQ